MINPMEIILPETINEALLLLSDKNKNARIIAGGTDVVPGIGQGSARFSGISLLVDINHIHEMRGIEMVERGIRIGAAENFTGIIKSSLIKSSLPLLAKACSTIGSVQIRNRATIAGNFVNNAPCADTVPVLLVYNALVTIESINGKREIPLAEFLYGPYKTGLDKEEIVTGIIIPIPGEDLKGDFYKLGRRRAVAISRITLAHLISIREGRINELRIASGAVTPIGTRFTELEKEFTGHEINPQVIKKIAARLGEGIIEVTGLRWSSEYKLPAVQQLLYQMLHKSVYGGSDGE